MGRCDQAKLRNLLVIADRFDTAEPLLLWADSVGLGASWHRRFVPALHSRFDTILWDDSVAPATSAAGWKERLVDSVEGNQAKRHLWMSLQPSADEIAQASCGGISRVLSKPLMVESILAAQSISPQRTGRQSGGKRAVDIVTRRVSEGPHFAPR